MQFESRPELKELDNWIQQLYDCKQLAESQVKQLCDKVFFFFKIVLYTLLANFNVVKLSAPPSSD